MRRAPTRNVTQPSPAGRATTAASKQRPAAPPPGNSTTPPAAVSPTLAFATATIASTAEIACIAFASIFTSVVLGLMNRKTLYVFGVLLAIAGQIGTLTSPDFNTVVLFRGLAGLGEGLCIGLGFASLAQFNGGTKLLGYSSAISAAVTLSAT